jgi:hypothetical protein
MPNEQYFIYIIVKTFEEVMMYASLIDWFLAVFQLYHGVKKFHKLISSTRGPEIKKKHFVYKTRGLSICLVLDQHAYLDFSSASSLTQQSSGKQFLTCRFTRTHYPDSEPTSLCSFSLMLCA